MVTPHIISRRKVLRGLPLFSAAAVLPAVATPFEAESVDLIHAARVFEAALATYDQTKMVKDATRARFDAAVMPKPPEIEAKGSRDLKNGYRAHGYVAEREIDIEGKAIWPEVGLPNYVTQAHWLEKEVACHDGRTTTARMLRRVLAAAREYETSQKSAKEATGIAGDIEAFYWAGDDLRRALFNLARIPALTFYGLGVKATARLAVTGRDVTLWSGHGDALLAENIAAIFSKAGA